MKRALVITASDRVSEGVREDTSGVGVGERLEALGFTVQRAVLQKMFVPTEGEPANFQKRRYGAGRVSRAASAGQS